jgi:hypothetical protein
MLDLPEYEPMGDQQDHDETGLHQMVDFASHEHLRVVVVAVESDAKRLWRISWGEVEPNEDGTLRFIEPELIFAGDETLVGRRVSALNATTTESPLRLVGASTPSFDAGLPPQRIIKKRSTGTGDK